MSAPKSKGFGLSLIERSKNMPYLVMNMEFEPTGLVCRMKIDADRDEAHAARLFQSSQVLSSLVPAPLRKASSIFVEHGPDFPRKIFHGERLGQEIYVRIEKPLWITALRLKPVV